MSGVSVRLLAILSGDGQSWGPGQVVTVDSDEAERLIAMGAAVAVATPRHPLDHDGDGIKGGSPAGENATRSRSRKKG